MAGGKLGQGMPVPQRRTTGWQAAGRPWGMYDTRDAVRRSHEDGDADGLGCARGCFSVVFLAVSAAGLALIVLGLVKLFQ